MRRYAIAVSVLCALLGGALAFVISVARILEGYILEAHEQLPRGYYADRALWWRVHQLASDWRHAVKVNKDLEFRVDYATLADAINHEKHRGLIEFYGKLYHAVKVLEADVKWVDPSEASQKAYDELLMQMAVIEQRREDSAAFDRQHPKTHKDYISPAKLGL